MGPGTRPFHGWRAPLVLVFAGPCVARSPMTSSRPDPTPGGVCDCVLGLCHRKDRPRYSGPVDTRRDVGPPTGTPEPPDPVRFTGARSPRRRVRSCLGNFLTANPRVLKGILLPFLFRPSSFPPSTNLYPLSLQSPLSPCHLRHRHPVGTLYGRLGVLATRSRRRDTFCSCTEQGVLLGWDVTVVPCLRVSFPKPSREPLNI